MKYFYNDSKLKILRKDLRKNQTEAERKIWKYLRSKQIKNLKFYRQYSIGNYILDFYCPEARLAIEIDGGQYNEEKNLADDSTRTEFLKKQDIKVLRFWNNEVMNNIEGVLEKIFDEAL